MLVFKGVVLAVAPNQWLERKSGKRCVPVRFGLRPTPAAQPQR